MTPRTPILLLALAGACNVISSDLLAPGDASSSSDGRPGADAAIDAPPDPAMILRYAFEGEGTVVTDDSGHQMNGTLSDVSARTTSGRSGGAISLSGATPATQFVSLPDGVLTGVTDFTIAAWVKLDANTPWSRVYDIGNGLPDPANRFMYLTTAGYTNDVADGIHASSYGGSTTDESITATSTQLPLGVWKHLTLTGASSVRTLYVDGYPAATLASGPIVQPDEMEPIAPNSWIGRSRFTADPGLAGSLDDFRIYNRVLAQDEVANLAWPQHDYSYWRFDEATGTHAADSSDNAIDAALENGATWSTEGRLGGALDLGGSTGTTGPQVTLASSPLAGCTTQFTISVWFQQRTAQPWSRIFDFGIGMTSFIYLAPTDGAGMHFAMVSPAGIFDMITPTQPAFTDGAWHHVAITDDSAGLVTLYVDGASVMTATSADVRPSDFVSLTDNWLGKSRFGDPFFDGKIDELRVACRAYTPDEITNLSRK